MDLREQIIRRLWEVELRVSQEYLAKHGAVPDGERVPARAFLGHQQAVSAARADECIRQMEWAKSYACSYLSEPGRDVPREAAGPLTLAPDDWKP